MGYASVKRLVDSQVQTLQEPFQLSEDLQRVMARSGMAPSQMKSCVFQMSVILKRCNRERFHEQVVNQLVQQVCNAQTEIAHKVKSQLDSACGTIGLVLLPDFEQASDLRSRAHKLSELYAALPPPSDVMRISGLEAGSGRLQQAVDAEVEEEMQAQLERRREWVEVYGEVHRELGRGVEEFAYNARKLAYLRTLRAQVQPAAHELADSDLEVEVREEAGLETQLERFKVLVERLRYQKG